MHKVPDFSMCDGLDFLEPFSSKRYILGCNFPNCIVVAFIVWIAVLCSLLLLIAFKYRTISALFFYKSMLMATLLLGCQESPAFRPSILNILCLVKDVCIRLQLQLWEKFYLSIRNKCILKDRGEKQNQRPLLPPEMLLLQCSSVCYFIQY